MASIKLDVCYNQSTETVDDTITWLTADLPVSADVIQLHSSSGGWPIVLFTGTLADIRTMISRYTDNCPMRTADLDEFLVH